MASDNTVRAFDDMKDLYINRIIAKRLNESKDKYFTKQDLDAADDRIERKQKRLQSLSLNLSPLTSEEGNSEPSYANVYNAALALSGFRESKSNWRKELPENVLEGIENEKTIKVNPKINNYKDKIIQINPELKDQVREAFSEYSGEFVSSSELNENYILEAIQIASEYFYESGLNEYGVEDLIELLGEEKFVDFVFDLIEDYQLTEENLLEWRRGPDGSRIRGDQTSKSGKPIASLKGGAKTSSIRATPEHKSRKTAKEAEPEKTNIRGELSRIGDRSKALRAASVQTKVNQIKQDSTKTVVPAKTKTTKKGILNTVAGAVLKGIERHNTATRTASDLAQKTGSTLRKAASGVHQGAKSFGSGFASGVSSTVDAAKKTKKAVVGEDILVSKILTFIRENKSV